MSIDGERTQFINQFQSVISSLDSASLSMRAAVSHSINTVSSVFKLNFKSVNDFRESSREEQFKFLHKLTDIEKHFWADDDKPNSIGVGLFKMWLATLCENDIDLFEIFSKCLIDLCKDGHFESLASEP